jgi:EmrB/QacA subfamily drug resistance transporter
VLWVSQIAVFMVLLDVSIVNVALPSIQRFFDVSAATVQWVVSGYGLAFGLALVPAGRLGDMIGRRPMFTIALSTFLVTSALTGAAPGIELLIAGRVLQGAAGGMIIPQNSGMVQDMFRGAERGRAFGILGSMVGLSTAVGPVVGGLILTVFAGPDAWRWVFYINVPMGVLALVLVARLVPRSPKTRPAATDLDLVGSLLLGIGVLSLLLPVVAAEAGGLRGWPLLVVAVLALAGFALWERHTLRAGRAPLLDPRLMRTPGFPAGLAIGLIYFLGLTGIFLVLSLFFQHGLDYSPLRAGLALTPFALGMAASAGLAGRHVTRLGRSLTVRGLIVMIIGLVATALILSRVEGGVAGVAIIGPLLLAGVGGGMVTSPNITLTLQVVPVSIAGAAGAALQTAQRVGAAIGTAVLATAFYRVFTATDSYALAVAGALLCAIGLLTLALVVALLQALRHRRSERESPVRR